MKCHCDQLEWKTNNYMFAACCGNVCIVMGVSWPWVTWVLWNSNIHTLSEICSFSEKIYYSTPFFCDKSNKKTVTLQEVKSILIEMIFYKKYFSWICMRRWINGRWMISTPEAGDTQSHQTERLCTLLLEEVWWDFQEHLKIFTPGQSTDRTSTVTSLTLLWGWRRNHHCLMETSSCESPPWLPYSTIPNMDPSQNLVNEYRSPEQPVKYW